MTAAAECAVTYCAGEESLVAICEHPHWMHLDCLEALVRSQKDIKCPICRSNTLEHLRTLFLKTKYRRTREDEENDWRSALLAIVDDDQEDTDSSSVGSDSGDDDEDAPSAEDEDDDDEEEVEFVRQGSRFVRVATTPPVADEFPVTAGSRRDLYSHPRNVAVRSRMRRVLPRAAARGDVLAAWCDHVYQVRS